MKRAILIGAAGVVGVAAVSALFWLRSGPEPSQFAYLASPRITHMNDERMLVVEAVGDPNVVAGGAFKLLFAAYYKSEGVSRMQRPPAPRARWPKPLETPRAEWKGQYALPVPDEVTTIPSVTVPDGMRLTLETWEYGYVAEVLHVGPYSDEVGNINRLEAFIASSGHSAIGDHEEEYVRGPGMIFAGDPRKYITIIRLRVAPATDDSRID